MAVLKNVTMWTCDGPGCEGTTLAEGLEVPKGWVRVHVAAGGDFDLCSDRCGAVLFLERYEARAGKRLVRQPAGGAGSTPARAEGARIGNLTRWHRAGKHEENPQDGCPECEKETQP